MDSRIPSQESEKQLFKILISENNQKRFQCTVCSRILSRQQTFEIHLKTVHAYNGPQLFKRKYKLYEEDSSVKIPRQTLHYRQSKQQNRILAVDVNQLSCHEAVSVQDQVYQNDAGIYFSSNQANDTESSALCNNEDSDYNIESSVCSNQDIFTLFPVYNHEVDDAQFSDNETESESDLSSSDNGLTSESSTDESDGDISDVDELSKTDDCSEVKKISMAIMSYMSRHTLTNEAAKDMIELIKVMIPENELFKTLSLSTVQEVCGHCEIKAYDICEVCLCIFPDDNQIYRCTTEGCDGLRYKGSLAQQSRRKSKNSFATVNINDQLKSLLERDGIWKTVQQRVTTRGKSTITDIVDGKYYMKLCKAGQFLEDTNNISLIFNTDGAPLYSSSSVSLWPVFLAVNELPSPDRFSKQNMLMWGIWQGKGKPPFDVYFEPFATNMTELYNKGVAIVPPKYQNSICVKAAVIIGSTDLQGKAYLLDMTHHNGTNGCLTCEEPGLVVSQGKGHTRCYPYKTEPKAAKKRTGQSFLKNAFKANDRKEEVKGVFGVTSLALMEWFDIVLGMVPDYMHGCLLGVTKSLLYKWMSSKNHKKPFFVGGQISKINKRLMEMKPTDTLARLPRDLEKHFKNLKASELQAWLLYYSLPCLIGYLPDKYLLHFAHFAEGIFLLLGDAISPTNLCRARDLLNVFYRDFENLYGQGSCGLNVHNAGAHLVDYVEGWGPLWAWSTFGFEDMNGTLMDNTHGTGNVCRQLIWTLHAMSRLRFEVNLMAESNTKEFIRRMLSTKREVKNLKVANNCSVAGGVKKCQDFPEHISRAVNGLIGEGEVVKAARIVVGGHIFFSKHYSRMVKRNPCVVQFSDDSLGEIEYFAWNTASGGVVAIYRQVMINDEKPFFFNEAGHHVLRVQNERSELKVKKVEDILEKVLLLEGNPTNPCIIRFPNFNGVCG